MKVRYGVPAAILSVALVAVYLLSCGGNNSKPSAVTPVPPPGPVANNSVTTYHNDNARSGQNLNETILTATNVNQSSFGKLFVISTDGKLDAQPLYLPNLSIAGKNHNVLFVATEHGSVYGFDADTGTQVWQVSTLLSGETPSDDHGCGQITPEIGVTSTPVIARKPERTARFLSWRCPRIVLEITTSGCMRSM